MNVQCPVDKGIEVTIPDKDKLADIVCQQDLLIIKTAESER